MWARWAAWYITRLLIEEAPKGVVVSVRFLLGHELILEVGLPSVQADALHGPVSCQQHCASRGLIHTSGLHAHKPALHNVDAPNAILPGNLRATHTPTVTLPTIS